jgi:hypothetical protein
MVSVVYHKKQALRYFNFNSVHFFNNGSISRLLAVKDSKFLKAEAIEIFFIIILYT